MSHSALDNVALPAVANQEQAEPRRRPLWSVPMDGNPASTEQQRAEAGWQRLLCFLAQGQADTGTAYERTRTRLVDFFASRGERNCDELADLTFDRLVSKLSNEDLTAVRSPLGYTLRFAHFIYLETVKTGVAQRRRLELTAPDLVDDRDAAFEQEEHHERLAIVERCLAELDADERTLLLSYYRHSGRQRITSRQELSRAHAISAGTLRTRVSRLCAQLERRARALAAAG